MKILLRGPVREILDDGPFTLSEAEDPRSAGALYAAGEELFLKTGKITVRLRREPPPLRTGAWMIWGSGILLGGAYAVLRYGLMEAEGIPEMALYAVSFAGLAVAGVELLFNGFRLARDSTVRLRDVGLAAGVPEGARLVGYLVPENSSNFPVQQDSP